MLHGRAGAHSDLTTYNIDLLQRTKQQPSDQDRLRYAIRLVS